MTGVVTGGWGFVWAVYGLSLTLSTIYTASVILRWKRECQRAATSGVGPAENRGAFDGRD